MPTAPETAPADPLARIEAKLDALLARAESPWLDLAGAAEYARHTVRTVQSWIDRPWVEEQGPHPLAQHKIGKRVLIARADLDAFLAQHRRDRSARHLQVVNARRAA